MSYPVCSFITEKAQQCIVDILASLEAKPKTTTGLGKALGMPRRTVDRYLTHLHRGERKRIFICGVEKRLRGNGAPIFAVGSAPDVFEPILRSRPQAEAAEPQPVTLLAALYEMPPADPWLAWIPRRDDMREAA